MNTGSPRVWIVAALVLLAGAGAAGWWALGDTAPSPAPLPHRQIIQPLPVEDLRAIDRAASTMPIPASAVREAVRKCRLTGASDDCRYSTFIQAEAAERGR